MHYCKLIVNSEEALPAQHNAITAEEFHDKMFESVHLIFVNIVSLIDVFYYYYKKNYLNIV